MAQKTIKAVILDAMFAEAYVETVNGEQFVGSIELQIRDIQNDDIYIKKLTEADLCEITGINKTFSSLEIIKIAEHIRRFTQPIELIVDDRTHLVSNEMIMAGRPDSESETIQARQEPPKATKTRTRSNKDFGFDAKQGAKAIATHKRKRPTSA